jgi:predicted phage terminase large subunit-like protein
MSDVIRAKAQDWISGTVGTRLNNKNDGVIILIMQRLHVDDPVAHVLEKGGWVHLNLPAIAEDNEHFTMSNGRTFTRQIGEALHPERESLATLEREKAQMGSFWFSAQYQQRPVAAEGNLFKADWFKSYEWPPDAEYPDQIIQAWDTALTSTTGSDYSVATTWIVEKYVAHLIDVQRVRLEIPALKRKIVEYKQQHNAGVVLIEDSPGSLGLIQQLEFEGIVFPIAIKPVGDKRQRASSVSAMIEAKRVLLPAEAPWLGDFMTEILAFPAGRHDDQVDSMTLFLNWFSKNGAPFFFG